MKISISNGWAWVLTTHLTLASLAWPNWWDTESIVRETPSCIHLFWCAILLTRLWISSTIDWLMFSSDLLRGILTCGSCAFCLCHASMKSPVLIVENVECHRQDDNGRGNLTSEIRYAIVISGLSCTIIIIAAKSGSFFFEHCKHFWDVII